MIDRQLAPAARDDVVSLLPAEVQKTAFSDDRQHFLGVLAALSVVAALYFLKFWRKTRDLLFLAFAASFLIRSLNDAIRAFLEHPAEATVWNYIVGFVASLLIVLAIIQKNVDRGDL